MTEFLLACRPDNDLYCVQGDGYPDEPTRLEASVWAAAREKNLRLYVELSDSLPGVEVGAPRALA